MSFVQLDNGALPPIDIAAQESHRNLGPLSSDSQFLDEYSDKRSLDGNNDNDSSESWDKLLRPGNKAQGCKIGIKLNDFTECLEARCTKYEVGFECDFLLAPIVPIRSQQHVRNEDEGPELLSDLAVPSQLMQSSIKVDLGYPQLDSYHIPSMQYVDLLVRHAIYLHTSTIVIDCPDSELGMLNLASIVNDKINDSKVNVQILIRISLNKRSTTSKFSSGWQRWNVFRSHLERTSMDVAVCLKIDNELDLTEEEALRWYGEPIRMIVINEDAFTKNSTKSDSICLPAQIKDFVDGCSGKNGLRVNLVLEYTSEDNVNAYCNYLTQLMQYIANRYYTVLADWNDKLQSPLQPLSSNLSSSTYGVFEMDSIKYIKYRDAMVAAIKDVIANNAHCAVQGHTFILMVLGAGRGPLVDSFISAIQKAADSSVGYKFKIYALDKNPSSVRALKYKQRTTWYDQCGFWETEVVEADMRSWDPSVKADIIASELLGSLGDNELSPECLDGVWRMAKPETINIPQEYTSYISPVSSWSAHQRISTLQSCDQYPYDQIYVARLTNCYHIADPKQLFHFEHKDISIPPDMKMHNQRYTTLSFVSKIDTVCHGFVGYFHAKLYKDVHISTVRGQATPDMNSWFPVYIPIESAIQMRSGDTLDLHFWRKEDSIRVWYEWVVTSPMRSRFHSPRGNGSVMSKYM